MSIRIRNQPARLRVWRADFLVGRVGTAHQNLGRIGGHCPLYESPSSDRACAMIAVRFSEPEPMESMTEFSFVFSS